MSHLYSRDSDEETYGDASLATLATCYYFFPLYDLDVSSGSVILLITTVAGAGTENYSAVPILTLPTGGSGEKMARQTASAKTGSADAILRRAED